MPPQSLEAGCFDRRHNFAMLSLRYTKKREIRKGETRVERLGLKRLMDGLDQEMGRVFAACLKKAMGTVRKEATGKNGLVVPTGIEPVFSA